MRNRTYWAPDDRQRGVDHSDHFERSAREDGSDAGRVTPGAIHSGGSANTDIGGKPDKTVTPGAITDIATPGVAAPPGSITDGGILDGDSAIPSGDSAIGSTGRDAL
jgi:hypothetical protein